MGDDGRGNEVAPVTRRGLHMKTSELLGNDLDWAVAKCEGIDVYEQIGYGD